jgi:HAD hydrolase, family IA, variant 3
MSDSMYGSASASVQFDSSFKRENTDTRLILPVEGILELLQTLKKNGYRLYLLSNAAIRQHEYLARAEASKLMDGTLISADVKLLKTDPQIYQTFLKKFDLKAEECVFIDDTPINVEGALYENMAGIVFNMNAYALKQTLCALGVEY